MDERRCVEVLRAHNEWRRYDGFTGEPGAPAMVNPTELGQALDHAIATIERERWRPIESAPKDGTQKRILLSWADGTVEQGMYLLNETWQGFRPESLRPWPKGQPTYWRPLPDPQPDGQEGT